MKVINYLRERWVNFSGITASNREKDGFWIRFRRLILADRSFILLILRMLPKGYITKDGFGITPSCRKYLEPLIKGEDYPPYKAGLPVYARLKNVAVPKKLKKSFDV
jgi:hypothetical protein